MPDLGSLIEQQAAIVEEWQTKVSECTPSFAAEHTKSLAVAIDKYATLVTLSRADDKGTSTMQTAPVEHFLRYETTPDGGTFGHSTDGWHGFSPHEPGPEAYKDLSRLWDDDRRDRKRRIADAA